MAAMWLLLAAAEIVQGCLVLYQDDLGSQATMEIGAKAQHISIADSGSSHHQDSLSTCIKHCEDSAVGVIKFVQQDFDQLSVLALTFYLLAHITALLRPTLKPPSQQLHLFYAPPATIRYHRFNI